MPELKPKMKPYMGYCRSAGPEEGAVLIFAHNLREAKKVGWKSELRDWCDGTYTNLAVEWIQNEPWLAKEADPDRMAKEEAHVVVSPKSCNCCEQWGFELNAEGYCEICAEKRENPVKVAG
jgi:hypothetical protein